MNQHQRRAVARLSHLVALLGVTALAGCSGGGAKGATGPTVPTNPTPPTNPTNPTTPSNPGQIAFVREDANARAVLAKMTLEEKAGQMIMAEQSFLKSPADIANYHLGALLSGAGSGPRGGSNDQRGWTNMIAGYQSQAAQSRLKIPLLYGIDAVHGNNNVPGATLFPHNIGLGATRDPGLVERIAAATAEETRAIGANWDFSPCVTIPQDVRWGRTYEGFSQDPNIVSQLGDASVQGLQGQNLTAPASMLACAKHFVGDGGTTYGTSPINGFGLDQGDTRLSLDDLRDVHLPPFRSAISSGVGSIMVSYSSLNGLKMSQNRTLLTDVLRGELGFEGIVLSDYDALDQLGPDYKTNISNSVNAGLDMIMVTDKYQIAYNHLIALVKEGRIPQARMDDAVLRILRVKSAMGLLKDNPNVAPAGYLAGTFGGAAHRDLARQAVRQSLVLLKNDNRTLPLAKNIGRLAVSGSGADDTGRQCGGWSVVWQGQTGNVVPGATSILSAIKKTVSPQTQVSYSRDGQNLPEADANLVIVGETPYAEYKGDARDLTLPTEDAATIARARQTGKPTVVVMVSGRPQILGDSVGNADALVAAWLPGSEGQGVADVLFGDTNPTGKMPVVWPRSMDQLPINLSNNKPNPLFGVGFGLSY